MHNHRKIGVCYLQIKLEIDEILYTTNVETLTVIV